MININVSGNKKIMQVFSLVVFVIGLVLLLLPGLIGFLGIRIAAVLLIAFCGSSLYVTLNSSSTLDNIYLISGIVGGIIIFIFPSLVMVFTGIGILVFGIYNLYKVIKYKYFEDKTSLIIDIIAVIIGLYFIFNGSGAIRQVVRILGISCIALSSIIFYKSVETK